MIIRAWHFVGDTLRDGRPVPPDGEWLVHDGPVKMCESGLHASRDPFGALQFAPGPILCMVDCADVEGEDTDKLVCRSRRIVKRIDATNLLWGFARQCAPDVVHLWDAPQIVRDYLTTGDESIRASAWAAAYAAYAAWASAWASAKAADNVAAWAAARDAQRARFNTLVQEAFA